MGVDRMAVKIILFRRQKTIISTCISIVTGSNITHSAVLYDGDLFDSSETRGKFGKAKIKKLRKRTVEVYHIGASDEQATAWLMKHHDKRYDYAGVLQWLLFYALGRYFEKYRLNSRKRIYCFEATAALISRVTGLKFRQNITGDDLKRTLNRPEFVGQLREYI